MVCSFTHQDASANSGDLGDVRRAALPFIYTLCKSCWFDVDQGGRIHEVSVVHLKPSQCPGLCSKREGSGRGGSTLENTEQGR